MYFDSDQFEGLDSTENSSIRFESRKDLVIFEWLFQFSVSRCSRMDKRCPTKSRFSWNFLLLELLKLEFIRLSSVDLVKTKECPSCAMEVDSSSKICPICQFEFPRRAPWITGMAIFLRLVWLLSYLI